MRLRSVAVGSITALLTLAPFIGGLTLAGATISGCTSHQTAGKVTAMPPMEAAGMLRNDFAVLVDVREPDEQKDGMAEGALSMPTSKIQANDPDWQKFVAGLPKGKKIIFYCASGGRAGKAAQILASQGFDTANIGGYKDWVAAGLPVKKP